MQEDMQHMEYLDDDTGLIFRWRGTSLIDVGRPAEILSDDEGHILTYSWDKNINVFDYETGELTIPVTYEAFKAKVLEWIQENKECDSE